MTYSQIAIHLLLFLSLPYSSTTILSSYQLSCLPTVKPGSQGQRLQVALPAHLGWLHLFLSWSDLSKNICRDRCRPTIWSSLRNNQHPRPCQWRASGRHFFRPRHGQTREGTKTTQVLPASDLLFMTSLLQISTESAFSKLSYCPPPPLCPLQWCQKELVARRPFLPEHLSSLSAELFKEVLSSCGKRPCWALHTCQLLESWSRDTWDMMWFRLWSRSEICFLGRCKPPVPC